MVIKDAFWEKRNLNIETVEIEFSLEDTVSSIRNEFSTINAEYIVAKVPSSMMELSEFVQSKGFRYKEDLILVTHDLCEVVRNPLHQRLYDALTYRSMNEQDIGNLYEEIRQGMFSTDRISTDDRFTKEQAVNRYVNWIKDLLKKKALPYVFLYKGEPAGFIILTSKDSIHYDSILGGGYTKFRKSGLGIIQKEQEIVKNLGGKQVSTRVSSNNPGQLKALIMNGYMPKDICHIFVKHSEKEYEEKTR